MTKKMKNKKNNPIPQKRNLLHIAFATFLDFEFSQQNNILTFKPHARARVYLNADDLGYWLPRVEASLYCNAYRGLRFVNYYEFKWYISIFFLCFR